MALFTRPLKKSVPTFLCFIFAAAAASNALLATHYRGRARNAESAIAKEQGRSAADRSLRVSQEDKTYVHALSERYGLAPKDNIQVHDVVSLAVKMNTELNRAIPAEYSTARTPWLSPPPRTMPQRTLADMKEATFAVDKGRIELDGEPTLYQYAIFNPTSVAVPLPILHSGIRWDDAEKMVESAGLRSISDETDRAIAIWQFVSKHRYHAKPVTEGAEEHDTVKFFSCYGYGFCDDASQGVAGLAKLCGLKARIWGLEGHVVSEIFADGRWMLLDADFAVYFHKPAEPRMILGVEELAKDRAAFKNAVQLGSGGEFEGGYAEFFLTTADNKPWPVEARSEHRIAGSLAPGEKIVFSNFNWGSYFLGAYPQRVPRYFNGYFSRPLPAESFSLPAGVEIRRDGESFTIANSTTEPQTVAVWVEYPFPIVGGVLTSSVAVELEFEDRASGRKVRLKPGREIPLESAVTQVAKQPTTAFTLRIFVPAGGLLKFDAPPQLISDFQFAELPLLRLKNGSNEFQVHSSEPTTLAGLKGEVLWR